MSFLLQILLALLFTSIFCLIMYFLAKATNGVKVFLTVLAILIYDIYLYILQIFDYLMLCYSGDL